MSPVKVSVVKTQDAYEGVRRALVLLDAPGPSLNGAHVLVKPNVASPFPPEEGPAITHPEVIGALIRYLRDHGARRVLVGDEPVWGLASRLCYAKSGVAAVVAREGGELVGKRPDAPSGLPPGPPQAQRRGHAGRRARLYTSLRERFVRRARCSASSKTSGTDTAIFIP